MLSRGTILLMFRGANDVYESEKQKINHDRIKSKAIMSVFTGNYFK